MLINKAASIAVGDVVGFKLVSSEEIIAKLVAITDTHYQISKPMSLIPGQQGLKLIQAILSMATTHEPMLQKSNVMMAVPVVDELSKHYLSTTSGIQLVTA